MSVTHWNYRIFRYSDVEGDSLGVHEAYYEDGKVIGYTKDPVIVGDSIEDLKEVLAMISRDIERCKDDILDYDPGDFKSEETP